MSVPPEQIDCFFNPALARLTDREKQVICLFLRDISTKESGGILGISRGRVAHYKKQAMGKLCVNSDFELVLFGVRTKLIDIGM
jgi:DNA-binding CsgD family transcriptional regulator